MMKIAQQSQTVAEYPYIFAYLAFESFCITVAFVNNKLLFANA